MLMLADLPLQRWTALCASPSPSLLTPADQRGNTVCLGFAVGAIVISGILTARNVLENRRRDRQFGKVSPADSTLENLVKPEALKRFNMEGKSREEVLSLGDRHRAAIANS